MKNTIFFFLSFLIFSYIKPEKIYGQTIDLIEQINSFNNEKITFGIKDLKKVINTKEPKIVLADELCHNLNELKKECIIGYVHSKRLVNKLNYYNKLEYIEEINSIGSLFKRLHKHLDEMHNLAQKMSQNPDRYKTKTLAFFNKKLEMVNIVQNQLKNKTKKLSKIKNWEIKYAQSNISAN